MESVLPWLIFVSVVAVLLLSVKLAVRLAGPDDPPQKVGRCRVAEGAGIDEFGKGESVEEGSPERIAAVAQAELRFFKKVGCILCVLFVLFLVVKDFIDIACKYLPTIGHWIAGLWYDVLRLGNAPLSTLTFFNVLVLILCVVVARYFFTLAVAVSFVFLAYLKCCYWD